MSYEQYVIEAVLAKNRFNIKEVKKIEILKCISYDKQLFDQAVELINLGDVQSIKNLEYGEKTFEDITIVWLADQDDREYLATVYDSDELWQDPVIMDIYSKQ